MCGEKAFQARAAASAEAPRLEEVGGRCGSEQQRDPCCWSEASREGSGGEIGLVGWGSPLGRASWAEE